MAGSGHSLGKPSITGIENDYAVGTVRRWLTRVLGTGLGTGYLKHAQGTAASALFVLLWVLFVPKNRGAEWTVALSLNAASVPLGAWGEKMWGEDPGRITVDEFAGQAIALAGLPSRKWPWLLLAFLLFRLFDVFKFPFTKRHIEPIPNGWGVTLDDTLAGVLAWIVLSLFRLSFRN
ncbi:phosphatidylglycerophosphatase A [bacterium BMS3Bbin04]|nr:phosphatidylglycerophosphatase A [bacterium BMS3Bbin04]